MTTPRTLFDKLWQAHVITTGPEGDLLYIDLHLTHEVTTPQAFAGLRMANRPVHAPQLTISTADHDVPTDTSLEPAVDTVAGRQLSLQHNNCADFGITLYPMGNPNQGIVHVIGPEQGLVCPGMTVVCGDSHTSTHGAFGALAFGIGTSQVEHVLATQTLRVVRPKVMRVELVGTPSSRATAKDLALKFLAEYGTNIGNGHAIEFCGSAVEKLSMEGRMTLCNMAIEAGARMGMVAPDQTTVAWLRKHRSERDLDWGEATNAWQALSTDPGAVFDREISVDVEDLGAMVTWGITPAHAVPFGALIPEATAIEHDQAQLETYRRATEYTGLDAGTALAEIPIDMVFIGSCTNGRIEDFRAAATILKDQKINSRVRMLAVPGSAKISAQAESEGIADIFRAAGAEWRLPGCSMCIAMNDDVAPAGAHVASTSNRNFVNRQGPGVTTHLMSPQSAAACAITGRLDVDLQHAENREN